MASKLARKRTVTYSLAAAFLAVVVVGSGVTVAAYKWDWGGDDEPLCPSPREATGVSQPEKVDPKGDGPKLKVVDEGLKPLESGEDVSFGVVVENTTDKVLYDATVSVSFIDDNGEDPTELLLKDIYDSDERAMLTEVPVPMILPGEKYGFGSTLQVAARHVFVTEDDIIEMDEIDFEDLRIDVSLKSGEWWEPKNDSYMFEKASAKNLEEVRVENADSRYTDGTEMVERDLRYEIDQDSCADKVQYTDSAVFYDSEGNPVGGRLSRWPITVTVGAKSGIGTAQHIFGPEGEYKAEIYVTTVPMEPRLEE